MNLHKLELEVTCVTCTGRVRYPWRVAMEWLRQNAIPACPASRAQSVFTTLVINFSDVVIEDVIEIAHLPILKASPDNTRKDAESRGGTKNK